MSVLSKVKSYNVKPKAYKALVAAAMLGAAQAVNHSMDYGWRKIAKEDPPRDPLTPHISWRKTIMWVIFTGIFVALARFFVERITYYGWTMGMHEDPRKY